MNADIQPIAVPEQLSQWRPACDMFADFEAPCDNGAEYAMVTHNGCQVKLTCAPCYERFRSVFSEWLDGVPQDNVVVCRGCGSLIDNGWGALHVEKL